MRVMIAESEYMSRHFLMQLFAEYGVEMVSVNTAEQAWIYLNSEDPPNLLILDAKRPKFDALEICRKIRESKQPRYTYIVLLMPPSSTATLLTALDAGADDYLTRPINRDELRARVRVARRVLEKEEQLTRIIRGWRIMLDDLPFGVAALGRNDEFLRVNRVFFDLLGYEMKEVLGKNLLASTLRRTCDLARVRDAIRRSQPFDWIEMDVYHKNGTKQSLVVWGRPINAGNLVFQIVTATE